MPILENVLSAEQDNRLKATLDNVAGKVACSIVAVMHKQSICVLQMFFGSLWMIVAICS
jgi:hypothetical protein